MGLNREWAREWMRGEGYHLFSSLFFTWKNICFDEPHPAGLCALINTLASFSFFFPLLLTTFLYGIKLLKFTIDVHFMKISVPIFNK